MAGSPEPGGVEQCAGLIAVQTRPGAAAPSARSHWLPSLSLPRIASVQVRAGD